MERGTGPGRHPWFRVQGRPRTAEEEQAFMSAMRVDAFIAEARMSATVLHDRDDEPGLHLLGLADLPPYVEDEAA